MIAKESMWKIWKLRLIYLYIFTFCKKMHLARNNDFSKFFQILFELKFKIGWWKLWWNYDEETMILARIEWICLRTFLLYELWFLLQWHTKGEADYLVNSERAQPKHWNLKWLITDLLHYLIASCIHCLHKYHVQIQNRWLYKQVDRWVRCFVLLSHDELAA